MCTPPPQAWGSTATVAVCIRTNPTRDILMIAVLIGATKNDIILIGIRRHIPVMSPQHSQQQVFWITSARCDSAIAIQVEKVIVNQTAPNP